MIANSALQEADIPSLTLIRARSTSADPSIHPRATVHQLQMQTIHVNFYLFMAHWFLRTLVSIVTLVWNVVGWSGQWEEASTGVWGECGGRTRGRAGTAAAVACVHAKSLPEHGWSTATSDANASICTRSYSCESLGKLVLNLLHTVHVSMYFISHMQPLLCAESVESITYWWFASGRGFVGQPTFLDSASVSAYVCRDACVGKFVDLSI
jgi:hypothetical protein